MIKPYRNRNKELAIPASKALTITLATALVCVLLSACGGSGGENEPQALTASSDQIIDLPADTISRIGTIAFTTIDANGFAELGLPSGYVSAYAEFTDYHQVINKSLLDSQFPVNDIETCQITIDSTDDSQDVGVENNAETIDLISNSSTISAGEALSISTPNGSWPDLILVEQTYGEFQSFDYEFQTDISTLGALPAGSSVSIPGGDFPAFENLSIPAVEKVVEASLSNVVDGLLTPETTVTWAAPKNLASGSITTIASYSEVVDDANNAELSIEIRCVVRDDGEFSFPDNVRQLLSKYDVFSEELGFGRLRATSEVQGDAAAIVINAAFYFF